MNVVVAKPGRFEPALQVFVVLVLLGITAVLAILAAVKTASLLAQFGSVQLFGWTIARPAEWTAGGIGLTVVLAMLKELKGVLANVLDQYSKPSTIAALKDAMTVGVSTFSFFLTIFVIAPGVVAQISNNSVTVGRPVTYLYAAAGAPVATLPLLYQSNAGGTDVSSAGIALEEGHLGLLEHFVSRLAANCPDMEAGRPISLFVVGFASSAEFPADSDRQNLDVANSRARAAKAAIEKLVQGRGEEGRFFHLNVREWGKSADMVSERQILDRLPVLRTKSTEFLNRRTEVRLMSAGKCQTFVQVADVLLAPAESQHANAQVRQGATRTSAISRHSAGSVRP